MIEQCAEEILRQSLRIFDFLHRAQKFIFSAVIDREVEGEPGLLFRLFFHFFDQCCERRGNAIEAARMEEACLVFDECFSFFPQILLVDVHEHFNFLRIALPVFGGEAPDGQNPDTRILPAPLGDTPEVLNRRLVALPRLEQAFFGPATVAVGNDREVDGGR